MTSKLSFAVTIFLGAFLLFQVQPLIAKIILPWFGGAAAVWIVCLLFFQFVLLFGYAYAHWLTTKLRSGTQARVHLLTLQAFELYFRQLKPQGIVAVHVSNQFLNLRPVVGAAAAALGKEAVLVQNSDDHANGIYASNWMLVGDAKGFEGQADIEDAGMIILPGTKTRLWTDDFSNLFQALR